MIPVLLALLIDVTNIHDSGPGSLRAAIEQANAVCVAEDCAIKFQQLPAGSVIEPLAPLPPLTSCRTTIDADLRVTLSGARAGSGSGLVVHCGAVHDLAITGFTEDGIRVLGPATIQESRLTANGLRGVSVVAPGATVLIRQSELSGNVRSGLFAWDAELVSVTQSKLNGNGASGAYARVGKLDIVNSEVQSNREFGVALDRGVANGYLHNNRIEGNVGLPIDWHLDGPTPNDSGELDRVPNAPVLGSVRYDPQQRETFFTGIQTGNATNWGVLVTYRVDLYLDGEYVASYSLPEQQGEFIFPLEFRLLGDHTGRRVNMVTQVRRQNDVERWLTSEMR
ncbi:MAG TPA: right-handed parallel beta-helix repeat-containing protein [Thermoanaerobaculia bacterium]